MAKTHQYTADFFAIHQYEDYRVFQELAKRERDPMFKRILEHLITQEWEDFQFWKELAAKKHFSVSPPRLWAFILMRRILGLTFTAKFLEKSEHEVITRYEYFLRGLADPVLKRRVAAVIQREQKHERLFISQIKEEKVEFLSSIILGLNDGLIELTGALVGFSFALPHHTLVALSGVITGVAASFSMASSAYLQARYERKRNPRKAALYTGAAYLIVVVLLVSPFFFVQDARYGLVPMGGIAFLIIVATAGYTAVLMEKRSPR
ncbi:MAG: integral membrane protein [Parcubacteria group bacterium Gr01-1014_66]|nr:MAG: integral membrane protein [Parcubacteria group bacterium Gr01-1014_66]